MRKFFTLLVSISITVLAIAQAPNAFNYQAVVRNNDGDILSEQNVSFRMSILQGGLSGTEVYVETYDTITNEFGHVNFAIGMGNTIYGSISTIDWGADSHFLKVELDADGGSDFIEMGTSQLLSVPYALDAAKTEQRTFDTVKATESFSVGTGSILEIGSIVELTGTTHESNDGVVIDLPTGMNSTNTRVLDVAIYFYVFMGQGFWSGQGYDYGHVGYTIHVPPDEGDTGTMSITYTEAMRGQPYRIVLMKVNNAISPL